MVDLRFQLLLELFKDDRLSESESVEFEQMITSGDYDSWLEADLTSLLERNATHPLWTEEKQAYLLQSTLKRLDQEAPAHDAPSLATTKRAATIKWRRSWWAAAAVIIFALAMTWLLRSGRSSAISGNIPSTIRPGSNKAILLLDQGRQIILDSASDLQVDNVQVAGGEVRYSKTADIAYHTLVTPRGGRYRLVLPDGSRVWMNSASSLRYPSSFNSSSREVELQGEAYFEIKEDKSRPFIVRTRGVKVDVLGTSFDVMAYDDEGAVRTSLIEGSVRLLAGSATKVIRPGQQAFPDNSNSGFSVIQPDMAQVLAWKNGLFNFNDADINTIMRQVMRWYDVDVTYGQNLSNIELSGIISQREDIRQLLDILEETGKVHFLLQGRKLTVLPGHP